MCANLRITGEKLQPGVDYYKLSHGLHPHLASQIFQRVLFLGISSRFCAAAIPNSSLSHSPYPTTTQHHLEVFCYADKPGLAEENSLNFCSNTNQQIALGWM